MIHPQKKIEIQVDTNDGDYVSETNVISDEDIAILKPLFKKINDNRGNFPHGECADDNNNAEKMYGTTEEMKDALVLLDDYLPYAEYGFHSIVGVKTFVTIFEEDII